MRIVLDRSAATLLPIVQSAVAPGTIIEWRAYNRISRLSNVMRLLIWFCATHCIVYPCKRKVPENLKEGAIADTLFCSSGTGG